MSEIRPEGESYPVYFSPDKVVKLFRYTFPIVRVNGVVEFSHRYFQVPFEGVPVNAF